MGQIQSSISGAFQNALMASAAAKISGFQKNLADRLAMGWYKKAGLDKLEGATDKVSKELFRRQLSEIQERKSKLLAMQSGGLEDYIQYRKDERSFSKKSIEHGTAAEEAAKEDAFQQSIAEGTFTGDVTPVVDPRKTMERMRIKQENKKRLDIYGQHILSALKYDREIMEGKYGKK